MDLDPPIIMVTALGMVKDDRDCRLTLTCRIAKILCASCREFKVTDEIVSILGTADEM